MSTDTFVGRLFESFQPRQMCMNYETDVIVLHAVSDALIMAAYYSIPLALLYLVRKRTDIQFGWMLTLFAGFIVLCGTTHLFDIIALWKPMYRLDGIVKAITGVVSVITAVALWPLIPLALAIPSPRQLQRANDQLKTEVDERRRAQATAESQALQLRNLTVQLTTAEERERRRLAMILHDHVQQLLAAAKLNIGTLEHPRDHDNVKQTAARAQQCLGDAIQMCRSLTAQLSPTILYDAGLAPAIEWLGRRMNELHGLRVEFTGDTLDPEPSEAVSVFLYQAANELLFNVKKHAGVGHCQGVA